MSKKPTPEQKLQKAVKDIVKEEVELTVAETLEADAFVKNPDWSEDETEFESEIEEPTKAEKQKRKTDLNKMFSALPAAEGYYGKLYHWGKSGSFEYVTTIDPIDVAGDIERTVIDLILQNEWRYGKYKLIVFQHGSSGSMKSAIFNISKEALEAGGNGKKPTGSSDGVEQMKAVASTIKELSELTGKNQEGLKPEDLSNSFKAGIEAFKSSLPPAQSPIEMMSAMMSFMKESGAIGGNKDADGMILQFMTLFKDQLFAKKNEDNDMLSQLMKAKELGLIKLGNENSEDSLSQMEKALKMMELAKTLAGTGGGKESFGTEVLRILAPQLPQIFQGLGAAIGNIVALSKGGRPQAHYPAINPPYTPPLTHNPAPGAPQSYTGHETTVSPTGNVPANPSNVEEMNPMLKDIYNAVQRNNKAFYTPLKQIICTFIGQHAFDALLTDQISTPDFLQQVAKATNQGFFLQPETKVYFDDFVSWAKQAYPIPKVESPSSASEQSGPQIHNVEEVNNPNEIIAICNECKEEFVFDSLEEFEESDKRCDFRDCEGFLTLKTKEDTADESSQSA